jgi:hypothetical protein
LGKIVGLHSKEVKSNQDWEGIATVIASQKQKDGDDGHDTSVGKSPRRIAL